MPYYDIHCHLDDYPDAAPIVEESLQAGVSIIVTNGTDVVTNRTSLDLAQKFEPVQAALGLYPNEAIKLSEHEIEDELAFIRKQDVAAVGEVGIDYHHDAEHKSEMKRVFEQCISLAEKMKKPMLVHSRKAESDVIDMIESSKAKVDLHCFGGSLKLAKRARDFGAYFSIPATIVRATHFQRLVEEVPLAQLLTETDAPWLSPSEEKNTPANIPLVVQKIADIKGLTEVDCSHQLWMNAQKFLR